MHMGGGGILAILGCLCLCCGRLAGSNDFSTLSYGVGISPLASAKRALCLQGYLVLYVCVCVDRLCGVGRETDMAVEEFKWCLPCQCRKPQPRTDSRV